MFLPHMLSFGIVGEPVKSALQPKRSHSVGMQVAIEVFSHYLDRNCVIVNQRWVYERDISGYMVPYEVRCHTISELWNKI